jgi:hypothetical protein
MELERETVRRMAECFAGHVCCRCRRPAERLTHQHFYCGDHFPRGRKTDPEFLPRVYKFRPFQAAGRPFE